VPEKPDLITSSPTVFQIIGPFVKSHHWALAGAVGLNAIHGFAITFQVFTVGWLVDWVLDKGNLPDDMWRRTMALVAGYFLVSVFGRMLAWHLGYRLFTRVREKILSALRANFFHQLNVLCLRFHMKRSSGELFSYLFGSPLNNIIGFYQHCSSGLAGAVTTIISAVGMLLLTDWGLTTILSLTVFVQVYMMDNFRRANRKIHLDFQNLETRVTGTVADLLRGTSAVKLYAMEETVEGEFGQQIQLISNKSYERDVRVHFEWMKQETLSYIGYSLMLAACAWRFSLGKISIGEVSMFMLAFQQLSGPLTIISQAFALWGSAQASIERIGEVLQTTSTTPDPVGHKRPVPPDGDIEMRGVRFGYDDQTVLDGVSFRIPYGQSVALVGPSGSGKSTIAQLLLRLYDPDDGEVLLGGQNLRHCAGAEVRRRYGVVPQDPFIFRTTIRQNLRVADAEADDTEIEQACRKANAWEFIEKLPHGLDAPVGEGGSSLSGGQRQRLAIARALLADPPFFLFDEATSALDTLSEQLIQETMHRVCAGRTAIIIAHRLATVKDCDRIIVIKSGKVEQDGTYDELMSAPGPFQDLVQGQQLNG
jgi:ABC-type multidrug transport system fused ATPase/permease subunit